MKKKNLLPYQSKSKSKDKKSVTPLKKCNKNSPTKKKVNHKDQSNKKQSIFDDKTITVIPNLAKDYNQLTSNNFGKIQRHKTLSNDQDSFSQSISKQKKIIKPKLPIRKQVQKDHKVSNQNIMIHVYGHKFNLRYRFIIKNDQKGQISPHHAEKQKIKQMEINAKKLIKQGKLADAEKILQQIILKNSKSIHGYLYLGEIYKLKGNYQKAYQFYKKCLEIDRNDIKSLYQKGCCLFDMEEYQNAIIVFNQALKVKPKNKRILEKKGDSEVALQNLQDALETYKKCIQFQNCDYIVYVKIGDIYNHFGMLQNAIKNYNKYLDEYNQYDEQTIQKKLSCEDKLARHKSLHQIPLERVSSKQNINERIFKTYLNDKNYIKAYNQHHKIKKIKNIQMTQQQYLEFSKGLHEQGFSLQAKDVINDAIINNVGLKSYQLRAKINFELGLYEQCQDDIKSAINHFQTVKTPLINFLLPNSNESQVFLGLKNLINKLQQLNAYNLTQSEDQRIINRRRICLNQAIRLFESSDSRDLSMILQQSSGIDNSGVNHQEQFGIFELKNMRKIMQNWFINKFSLQSLQHTAQVAFNLVKSDKDDFSVLPIHIISFMMSHQNLSFKKLNQILIVQLSNLCKKYPPCQIQLSKSKINNTKIPQIRNQKIDLFSKKIIFHNYREVYKAIQQLAKKAANQIEILDMITKQICQQFDGSNYKSGLKLPISPQGVQERILCRIIQKMFHQDLMARKQEFFEAIEIKEGRTLQQYLADMHKMWQQTISKIIDQRAKRQISTPCYVYDLMRAKCMFADLPALQKACKQFIEKDKLGQLKIIQLDNRLSYKTKDIALKIKFKQIVGQIQLGLKFQSIRNQFNHSLYQLHRSPFGPFFASIMWLSGYARKKKNLMIKQKLKWKLKGLEHLKKFIYEDKLEIDFKMNQKMIEQTYVKLYITDFQIQKNKIQGYLQAESGQYIHLKTDSSKTILNNQKPIQKIQFNLLKDTFILESDYLVQIKQVNSNRYLIIENGKILWKQFTNQSQLNLWIYKINFKKISQNCQDKIKAAIQIQKQVIKLISF